MSRPTNLPFKPAAVPAELKALDRWVLWRFAKKRGKAFAKIPFQASGTVVVTTDSSTWSAYDLAFDAYVDGGFDGMGVVFNGDGLVGIDLDDCVVDGVLSATATELLDRIVCYAEFSPSGTGIKVFTRSVLGSSYVDSSKGVEVYNKDRYFTVTGHVLSGHELVPDEPQDLVWFIEKHFGVQDTGGDSDALAFFKPPLDGWDLEKVVEEVLAVLPADCGYSEWVMVGQALYHQFHGDPQAMDAWDEWSASSAEKYQNGLCQSKWDSFSSERVKGRGPVTLASLLKLAGDIRAEERRAEFDRWKSTIEDAADANELLKTVCPGLAKDVLLTKVDRDVLAQVLKARFKALGYPVMLPDIKKMIKPKAGGEMPAWLEDWVYVTHEDKFFNVLTKRKVTVMGFNALYNREVGGFDTETKATVLALDLWKVPTPDKIIYLPSAGDMFTLNGQPCVNLYDPNSPPDVPAEYSVGDRKAIELVLDHLGRILTEQGAVEMMLSWMAFNVQRPGVKIRWAPLLKGIEGDGKTLIGKVLSAAMGMVNVGIVSPAVLGTPYTAWAEGRCVNVMEEIRIVGHNRYDVLNTIKPYITNDTITVHPKGVNEYVAPNTVNYIAFTNHEDALPLDNTDRRWWVLFSPFLDRETLAKEMGPVYFNRLHAAIEQHAGGLRRWLLEYELAAGFEPNGTAPGSVAKSQMIALSTNDGDESVRQLIEDGAPGVSAVVVSGPHLKAALEFEEETDAPYGRKLSLLMAKLGFTQLARKVRWQGKTCRVWMRVPNGIKFGSDEAYELAKAELDKTLGQAASDSILD